MESLFILYYEVQQNPQCHCAYTIEYWLKTLQEMFVPQKEDTSIIRWYSKNVKFQRIPYKHFALTFI